MLQRSGYNMAECYWADGKEIGRYGRGRPKAGRQSCSKTYWPVGAGWCMALCATGTSVCRSNDGAILFILKGRNGRTIYDQILLHGQYLLRRSPIRCLVRSLQALANPAGTPNWSWFLLDD